jgi:heat shock protein HslJ
MRHRALFLVGVAAVLVACSPGGDNTNGGLGNTSWTVISIAGQPVAPDARPTMTFDPGGTVSGNGGCNQYTGSFRTEGDRIAVGQVSSTLMGCEGERGRQEAAFLSALQGAGTWRLAEEGNLVIAGAGEIIAGPGVAEGPPGDVLPGDAVPGDDGPSDEPIADLAGTSWTLVELGGTADLAHLVPTLEFGADRTVSGFAGCNTFTGPSTSTGAELSLGPLATTRIGCQRPASAVEAEYLAALAGVTSWAIDDGGRLVLGGAIPLTFTRS